MRFRKLFALFIFLLAGSLLAPVKAETSYYAVSFDGVDDYVDVGRSLEITDRVTLVWFGKIVDEGADTGTWKNLAGQYDYGYGGFMLFWNSVEDKIFIYVIDSQGRGYWPVLEESPQKNAVAMYAFSYDRISGDLKGHKNGRKIFSGSYSGLVDLGNLSEIKFGIQNNWGKWKGEVYAVMIYNRVLSDEEIQQIYNDPMNPPQDGLVLWYAPDSVDTVNGLWRDKSENGNDGTIVGATAERVSIIRVRDYKTNADITLKSTITNLDTGETLFPIVDYNTPTTIKVEAQGYKTQIIKLGGFKPLYTVYMQPLLTELQIKFNVANYFPTAMWFLVAGVMGSIVAGIFSMSDRVGRKAKVVIVIVLGLIFFIYMLQFAL